MSRTFNASQRAALFDHANGQCQMCGIELAPGWHADHVVPYSRGGATDVVNGQALCPACNLAKSDATPFELRNWQKRSLEAFSQGGQDFLAVACPGAGKTTFALEAARRLLKAGAIERVIIVVPTSHLKRQWALAATRFNIDLDYNYKNSDRHLANDYQGIVVTYHQVQSNPHHHRLEARVPCLVIFDEIHHAGDDLAWGAAIMQAYGQETCRRLALSGTPFRTDKTAIPFLRYDAFGQVQSDYEYDYGKALYDGIVRPIEFPALDSEVRWSRASEIKDSYLSEANDSILADALNAALRPHGEWIPSVLEVANNQLTQARTEMPDAGGLLLASDKHDARAYAAMLEQMTGERPTIVLDDIPDASKQIEAFGKSSARWIIAVQMVSEGVDIPRLLVGVYATRYRTEMFFRQVVGRFIRRRHNDDFMSATLFIPSIQPLLEYATKIERTVEQALNPNPEIDPPEGPPPPKPIINDYEALGSSEAALHATVRSGDAFSPEQLKLAESMLLAEGFPASVTPSMLLRVMAKQQNLVDPIEQPAKPTIREETLFERKDRKRQSIKDLVNKLARMRGANSEVNHHKIINTDLNSACGEKSITQATIETLDYRIDLLQRWIKKEASDAS